MKRIWILLIVAISFGQDETLDYYLNSETGLMEMSVQIFGAVQHPGMVSVTAKTDLISLLAIVGGATENASLSSVKIIHRSFQSQQKVQIVDIEEFFKNGESENPILQPGDIVIISTKKSSKWKSILPIISTVLQIVNIALLITR